MQSAKTDQFDDFYAKYMPVISREGAGARGRANVRGTCPTFRLTILCSRSTGGADGRRLLKLIDLLPV